MTNLFLFFLLTNAVQTVQLPIVPCCDVAVMSGGSLKVLDAGNKMVATGQTVTLPATTDKIVCTSSNLPASLAIYTNSPKLTVQFLKPGMIAEFTVGNVWLFKIGDVPGKRALNPGYVVVSGDGNPGQCYGLEHADRIDGQWRSVSDGTFSEIGFFRMRRDFIFR